MSNREVIDQVDRGYRMAMPSHIHYPESRSNQKEIAQAQANVYKVSRSLFSHLYSIVHTAVADARPR
jgi:hypothetical protein